MTYQQKVTIGDATLLLGDCIEVMRGMSDSCVDSIVCDPPYLLGFMGKAWDAADGIAGKSDVWREALRVLKPGGHLMAFGAPRTNHRMVTAIEDAGFEIRDSIQWIFGSGFPKSMDVSKAIDKAAGAVREVVGLKKYGDGQTYAGGTAAGRASGIAGDVVARCASVVTAPATPAAQQWQGWGTALKPAYEPVCVARKPLEKSTVAANVLHWGTGGLNIDGCLVPGNYETRERNIGGGASMFGLGTGGGAFIPADGRWPANLILDGSPEVLAGFPETKSGGYPPAGAVKSSVVAYGKLGVTGPQLFTANEGSAARFFYTAKASKSDRGDGNTHPTVKPTDLMAYLCRLVTPPGGTVLDIFMGSGSTGKAAVREGFAFIGIEQNAEYFEISQARIEHAQGKLFEPERPKQVQEALI